jgi:hypothetical protein
MRNAHLSTSPLTIFVRLSRKHTQREKEKMRDVHLSTSPLTIFVRLSRKRTQREKEKMLGIGHTLNGWCFLSLLQPQQRQHRHKASSTKSTHHRGSTRKQSLCRQTCDGLP